MTTRSSDERLRKYANLSSQRSSRRLIRNGAFQGCGSPLRLGLTLRRGTDNNLTHVNIGGLLDRDAFIESFFSSLKYELVYHHRFATLAQARTAIFEYIEAFYNRTRLHSSLAYQTPINFESQLNQNHP